MRVGLFFNETLAMGRIDYPADKPHSFAVFCRNISLTGSAVIIEIHFSEMVDCAHDAFNGPCRNNEQCL